MEAIHDFSKYFGKISNCGHDERGVWRGGKAGDQSGTEWYIRSWFDDKWDTVIRFEDSAVADMIATLAVRAAENNRIGYDQNERTTYWTALKNAGYDPAKITTNCEADCSSGVLANIKAALILTGHPEQAAIVSVWGYTGNEADICRRCGAKVSFLRDAKYTKSPDYLLPGDILLNSTTHTATNLGRGKKVPSESQEPHITAAEKPCIALQNVLNYCYKCGLKVTGKYNLATRSAVKKYTLKKGVVNAHVGWLQEALRAVGYDLAVDNSFGPETEKAVADYQGKHGYKITGTAGKKVTKALVKEIRKRNKK